MDHTCPVVHKSRRPQARLKTVTLFYIHCGNLICVSFFLGRSCDFYGPFFAPHAARLSRENGAFVGNKNILKMSFLPASAQSVPPGLHFALLFLLFLFLGSL
jgi:hypothetical protein